jgi:hypothetical protein
VNTDDGYFGGVDRFFTELGRTDDGTTWVPSMQAPSARSGDE